MVFNFFSSYLLIEIFFKFSHDSIKHLLLLEILQESTFTQLKENFYPYLQKLHNIK
jgi:hypothetical protein